jgi:hypothetical protein
VWVRILFSLFVCAKIAVHEASFVHLEICDDAEAMGLDTPENPAGLLLTSIALKLQC